MRGMVSFIANPKGLPFSIRYGQVENDTTVSGYVPSL